MYKILIILLLGFYLHAQDKYELGNGVQISSYPIYLGGYFSVDYRNMNNENRYRLDDVALLSYGNYDKFSYMAEVEYKQLYIKTYTQDTSFSSSDTNLYLERLYADYNYNENYMFRVGKYNSPIGFWNLLPINVLRDTTSFPYIIKNIFPDFTTGLNLSYTSFENDEIKINVMLQHNEDLDDNYNNYKIDAHYGFGILYEKEQYSLKLNAGYFNRADTQDILKNRNYILLSGKYETEKFQLMSELGYQSSKNKTTTPYSSYIQGSYRFRPKHLGVLRVESYKNRLTNIKDSLAIFGYTYRPIYPISFKSEYQFHSIKRENKALISLSVMF